MPGGGKLYFLVGEEQGRISRVHLGMGHSAVQS